MLIWWVLRTFALIVSACPYCSCKSTRHIMHRWVYWVIKWTMIHVALPGFNNVGRSVTPYGSFSLPIFYVQRKCEQNLSIRSLNFLQNVPSNYIIFSSSFIWVAVSNASWTEGLSFVQTSATFGIIYTTDRLLQNTTKIIWFCWLTFDSLNCKLL